MIKLKTDTTWRLFRHLTLDRILEPGDEFPVDQIDKCGNAFYRQVDGKCIGIAHFYYDQVPLVDPVVHRPDLSDSQVLVAVTDWRNLGQQYVAYAEEAYEDGGDMPEEVLRVSSLLELYPPPPPREHLRRWEEVGAAVVADKCELLADACRDRGGPLRQAKALLGMPTTAATMQLRINEPCEFEVPHGTNANKRDAYEVTVRRKSDGAVLINACVPMEVNVYHD